MVLRVTRTLAADLPEPLDVIEGNRGLAETLILGVDRLHPGEMQQCIKQHRGVAVRKHEAIAIGPDRIVGVEAQEVLPQRVGHRRQCHRCAGMAGIGLLHGIHRERANGVYAKLIARSVLHRLFDRSDGSWSGLGTHRDASGYHAPRTVNSEEAAAVPGRIRPIVSKQPHACALEAGPPQHQGTT